MLAEGEGLGAMDDVTEVEPLTEQERLMEDARDFCVFVRPRTLYPWRDTPFAHLLPAALGEMGLSMVWVPGGWVAMEAP